MARRNPVDEKNRRLFVKYVCDTMYLKSLPPPDEGSDAYEVMRVVSNYPGDLESAKHAAVCLMLATARGQDLRDFRGPDCSRCKNTSCPECGRDARK